MLFLQFENIHFYLSSKFASVVFSVCNEDMKQADSNKVAEYTFFGEFRPGFIRDFLQFQNTSSREINKAES
ncbi:hypothetical protein AAGV27_12215 [Bacillus velezensis]